jgi:pilus assembly protein CpaB
MNRTAILVAAGVAILGFLLLAIYMRQFRLEATGGGPVELLAVRRDAEIGEPLTEQMLVVRTLPEAYVEDRHVHASDLPRVLGIQFSVNVRASQTLLWTDLTTATREQVTLSSRVPKGMRAMTISRTESDAFAGLLRPGDRVDVLLTRAKPGAEQRVVTVPLLQNLLVLAVGESVRAAHDADLTGRRDGVNLLLTIEQAGLLAQAQRDGVIRLVLRNGDDLEIAENLGETDDTDVLEQEKRAGRQRRLRLEKVD